MYGLRLASQEKQDELYPAEKQEEIEKVLATFYAVDIPAISFNLAGNKYAAIKYLLTHR